MNLKLACPHCQVVGIVPVELMNAKNWLVACHHCRQHYVLPLVSSSAPSSSQIDVCCAKCGQTSSLDKQAHKAILEGKFPLLCSGCHSSLTEGEGVADEPKQASSKAEFFGVRSALILILTGFFIVGGLVIAAQEGVIGREWLDSLLLHLPDRSVLAKFVADALSSSSETVR